MPKSIFRRNFLLGAGSLGAMVGLTPADSVGWGETTRAWADTVYNVRAFGATGDGKRLETDSIRAAINGCAAKGGGTVLIPAGRYLSGAIRLRSNINLHLDSGATILGSEDPADYPVYPSPWPDGTKQISSLIYGEGLVNVSITGRGTIDGQGRAWWVRQWLRSSKRSVPVPDLTETRRREEIAKIKFGRPRLIRLVRCKNVLLDGVTLTNSPEWNVNPVFCEYVSLNNLVILSPVPSPNTDGIDPESCRNVHISNCHIDVGDDCIAIKSGKDQVGRRVGQPCENVTITNLTTAHGHGGVSIGSEMSGGVRNVAISNCAFVGTQRGVRIKTQRGRGGVVEGVVASNIVMEQVREAFTMTMFYSHGNRESEVPVSQGTPRFRDFHFSNITARGSHSAGQITGLREMPISGVVLSEVRVEAVRGFSCQNANGVGFHNVRVKSTEGPALSARNVQNLDIDGFRSASGDKEAPAIDLDQVQTAFLRGCRASPGTSVFLKVAGGRSSDIVLRASDLTQAKRHVQLAQGVNQDILSEK